MRAYKIKIKITSGTITPFHADTIYGHLCWALAHRDGEKALRAFLEPFIKGDPPFLLSDGFPGSLLPKPLSTEFIIGIPDVGKEWKKIDLLNFDDFNTIRAGKSCRRPAYGDQTKIISTPHNTINRLTNTTLVEGGVFSLKEISVPEISIYLKAVSNDWKDQVIDLLKEVSKSGYGRKKSIGKGQFSVEGVSEFSFPEVQGANGFITLSNFCPNESDPTEGLFKTFVKYGKLGEEFTFCGNPFKRPLLMIKTGSVFRTEGKPKEFYGRMVLDGISPIKQEVVHYAYAFAVPIRYPQI